MTSKPLDILNRINDTIITIDREGKINYVNKAFAEVVGLTPSNMIGKNLWEILPRLAESKVYKNINEAIEKNQPSTFEWQGPYTDRIWETKIFPSEAGITAIGREITERKKAEEALKIATDRLNEENNSMSKLQEVGSKLVSEEKMQPLLEAILDAGIVLTHADMGTLQVFENGNLKIATHRGFEKFYVDFFNSVNEDTHAVCAEAMRHKSRVIVEDVNESPIFVNTKALEIQKRAGVRAVQSSPLFSRSGKFLGMLSTHYRCPLAPKPNDLRMLDLLVRQAADFIERMGNEQKIEEFNKNLIVLVEEKTRQLKDAERLVAIGATAGMVGHDIRNPLQAITSDLYLIKTDLLELSESEQKVNSLESLDGIQVNIDYINKIVQDLQDFAKALNPRMEKADIQSVVSNVLSSHRVPENITVTVDIDKQAQVIVADPDFMKRIVDNLILNAIQAMPAGGKLAIKAKKDKQTDEVILTINDTGVGIPAEVKDKLFTPMFTTKSKGQGFGLAVVKRMTEALGGTVTFESEHGKGTKFIVRLPPQELNGKLTYK